MFLQPFNFDHLWRMSAAGAAMAWLTACTPMTQPEGPPVVHPAMTADSFLMADGYRLPLDRSLPSGQPRAVVVALHGFNDYRASWREAAARWSRSGLAVYAYDQRGFGETERRGIWPGTETLKSDLRRVIDLVRQAHPDVPVYLVGESMGGALLMATLGDDNPPEVDGAVLSAPAVWSRKTMNGFYRFLLDMLATTMPGFSASGEGIGRRASDNDPMLRALGRDPLVIKSTRFDAVAGLVDLMDAAYAAAPKIGARVLVLYGLKDQLVPCEAVGATIDRFRTEPRIAIYRDGWHLLFRDNGGGIVQHDVGTWFLDPDNPLPSGAENGGRDDLCAAPTDPFQGE